MVIAFKSAKLRKTCNSRAQAQKRFGPYTAKVLMRRLDELRAFDALSDLRSFPPARCHELKGKLAGRLAVDLNGPVRLIFEPANDPIPKKPDGGLDWSRVTCIRVIAVEDYHG